MECGAAARLCLKMLGTRRCCPTYFYFDVVVIAASRYLQFRDDLRYVVKVPVVVQQDKLVLDRDLRNQAVSGAANGHAVAAAQKQSKLMALDRVNDHASSVDPREAVRYAALAETWWNRTGPFWPLHRLNELRVQYIRDQLCGLFQRDPAAARPLSGLCTLDIGCGGILMKSWSLWVLRCMVSMWWNGVSPSPGIMLASPVWLSATLGAPASCGC